MTLKNKIESQQISPIWNLIDNQVEDQIMIQISKDVRNQVQIIVQLSFYVRNQINMIQ